MKKWHAKEFGKLAQVSVRTLHHYDKIGLLKPSLRQSNNYRLYSETDLLRLQQIIALKFFGFELSQIKDLLSTHDDILENLTMQSKFLQEKAKTLMEASTILEQVTCECGDNKSIPWKQVIKLIEVYKMTQQLEDAWVKEIFNPEELKEYVKFEEEMKANSTPEKKAMFEQSWLELVKEVEKNLHEDPTSKTGIILAEKWMCWTNNLYGKKYAHLRTKKFEKGFGEGKGLGKHGLTPEIIKWMEKAMDAYWKERIYDVLDKVEQVSSSELRQLWNQVMDDMYGNEEQRKAQIPAIALKEDKVSQKAKAWLKSEFNL